MTKELEDIIRILYAYCEDEEFVRMVWLRVRSMESIKQST